MISYQVRTKRALGALAVALAIAGCGEPAPSAVLSRSSRSSTIAISEDDSVVVIVNQDDDSISTFTTVDNQRRARLTVGDEPSSVVLHPNGTTAFVANRGDATVMRIEGIDGPTPTIAATLEVGSEPTGLALSPTGETLFVAEHAEGSVGVIDTEAMERRASIDGPQNPYALAVTNDGDAEDDDELLIVPEFFGVPIASAEAQNATRTGLIRTYNVSDLASAGGITLEPIDSGFAPEEGGATVQASPNQIFSVSVQNGKVYATTIAVSPAAPIRFDLNIQPVIYVADLASRTEDRSPLGTVNLARRVKDEQEEGQTVFFLGDTVDMAFIGNSGVAYAVSRAADAVQRVVFGDETPNQITIGSSQNLQIDVGTLAGGTPCQTPNGITTAHDGPRAYVNCWVNQRLGVIDLAQQSLLTTVEAANPAAGEVVRGRRFFNTGRGRWSNNGWSSCASCHPGGYTDNITWQFGTGPRQSTSLDGSFSHGEGPQQQRIFNWTGVFDEMHDFERNTRGTSGGVGAVTNGDCTSLATETQIMIGGNLAQPVKELADGEGVCTEGDWDAIDAYVRTIRPPRALRFLDPAAVERGAALFGMPTATENNGGCVACHGGPGWTASRRFFTPSSATNTALMAEPFGAPDAWPDGWNTHVLQIAPQPTDADNTGMPVAPPQVACVLRNVGTFGIAGQADATNVLELRDNGTRAQGAGGYNVPSLYGLAIGAPYLHHGQAASLEELLEDPAWRSHLNAANPVFLTTGDADQQRADLLQFLLSIDADTEAQSIPAEFEGCPE